jgi:hypothetical protein
MVALRLRLRLGLRFGLVVARNHESTRAVGDGGGCSVDKLGLYAMGSVPLALSGARQAFSFVKEVLWAACQ